MATAQQSALLSRRHVGWVDNLRVAVIAGVIVVHTATGYVLDLAGWYYDDERDVSSVWSDVLMVPAVLAAVFLLGPLFFVAGWFSARAIARRGPGAFVRSRLLRLGVPLVAFVLLLNPLTDYLGNIWDERGSFWFYLEDTEVGAMWFVAALLAFSVAYALVRRAHPDPRPARPDGRLVLWAATAIAVSSFLVWQVWPLTEDAVLNLKFAEWPQGAVLFGLGVYAAEAGWVDDPPPLSDVRSLGWTALAGMVAFVALFAFGAASGAEDLGSPTGWPTMATAVLNGLVAVTGTIWFVVWFAARWPQHGRVAGAAARGSYATYVLHPLVVTLLMLAFAPLALAVWPKFVLVAAVAVPVCFVVGYAVTRLPGVSRVL
jgi:glucans biosynthesis protein C